LVCLTRHLRSLQCLRQSNCTISCFLLSRRTNRNMRSFPTRRSSDLRSEARARAPSTSACTPSISSGCAPWRTACAPSAPRWSARSEEHTSELQSREKLVCRLLLEKKKEKLEQ